MPLQEDGLNRCCWRRMTTDSIKGFLLGQVATCPYSKGRDTPAVDGTTAKGGADRARRSGNRSEIAASSGITGSLAMTVKKGWQREI